MTESQSGVGKPERRYLTISEIDIDLEKLDEYQSTVMGHVGNPGTPNWGINGIKADMYMAQGIEEEFNEALLDTDNQMIDYKRLDYLLQSKDPELLRATTPNTTNRHTKEFGDILWYDANMLGLYNIPMSQAAICGYLARELDRRASTRAHATALDTFEKTIPVFYFITSSNLVDAAKNIVNVPKDERGILERELVIESGRFIVSASHVLESLFDTTLDRVLDENIAKVEDRMSRNVVFGSGDDR